MITKHFAQRAISKVYRQIFSKWKHAANETAGWIVRDHVLWLDRSYCKKYAIWADDEVCRIMCNAEVVSFHTHRWRDHTGKESISVADKRAAVSFGAEIVCTYEGIYLLLPYKRLHYRIARTKEMQLRTSIQARIPNDEVKQEEMFEKIGHHLFKCHCYRIL